MENAINLTEDAEIGIVLTEEEMDELISKINAGKTFTKVYLGHDVLLDGLQVQVLKEKNVTVHVIPDYYYKELEG